MTSRDIRVYSLTVLILLLTTLLVLINADKIDGTSQSVIAQKSEQILTLQATAFCTYGWDENNVDYGPGYAIISDESEIPLYALLEIDQYGEAQAVAVSDKLAKDEIQLWYNAPSKIDMFGTQTVKVKILGEGDVPCNVPTQ